MNYFKCALLITRDKYNKGDQSCCFNMKLL